MMRARTAYYRTRLIEIGRRPRSVSYGTFGCVMLALIVQGSMGCALTEIKGFGGREGSAAVSESGVLELEISVRKTVYRPGEAVIARVRLINTGTGSILAPPLNVGSATFFFGSALSEERMRRPPVRSPREAGGVAVLLEPGGTLERNFVFTRLTRNTGLYVLTTQFDPNTWTPESETKAIVPKISAPPIEFAVSGERAFRRDSEGVLLKDDAILLCLAELMRPVAGTEALLVENEAGLLDWWVVAELAPESLKGDEQGRVAWRVNPYLGAIRGPTAPFERGMADRERNYRVVPRTRREEQK